MRCITGLGQLKAGLLLVVFDRDIEKGICHTYRYTSDKGHMVICSSNPNTAGANGVATYLSL